MHQSAAELWAVPPLQLWGLAGLLLHGQVVGSTFWPGAQHVGCWDRPNQPVRQPLSAAACSKLRGPPSRRSGPGGEAGSPPVSLKQCLGCQPYSPGRAGGCSFSSSPAARCGGVAKTRVS